MLDKPIYLITDGGRLRKQGRLISSVEKAFIGGNGKIGFLQLREQVISGEFEPASNDEVREILSQLKPLCREHGVKLIINSNIELAKECDLDGVHLGARSLQVLGRRWNSAPTGTFQIGDRTVGAELCAGSYSCNEKTKNPITRRGDSRIALEAAIEKHRRMKTVGAGLCPRPLAEIGKQLGNNKLIGFSAHSLEEVYTSFQAGANYVFISPIFKPHSKKSERNEIGLSTLKTICENFPEKIIFALGGIDQSNLSDCLEVGIAGVAMISAILLSDDPRGLAAEFSEMILANS